MLRRKNTYTGKHIKYTAHTYKCGDMNIIERAVLLNTLVRVSAVDPVGGFAVSTVRSVFSLNALMNI